MYFDVLTGINPLDVDTRARCAARHSAVDEKSRPIHDGASYARKSLMAGHVLPVGQGNEGTGQSERQSLLLKRFRRWRLHRLRG